LTMKNTWNGSSTMVVVAQVPSTWCRPSMKLQCALALAAEKTKGGFSFCARFKSLMKRFAARRNQRPVHVPRRSSIAPSAYAIATLT